MDDQQSTINSYNVAIAAYNDIIKNNPALVRAAIDADAAWTDAAYASDNAHAASADAVNDAEGIPATAVNAIDSYMSMEDSHSAQSIYERALGAANVANERATHYSQIIDDTFQVDRPDIIHVKHAAAAWVDSYDKSKEAANKRAALADIYATRFKRAAADKSAHPDIWPPHIIYKLTEAGAAWEHARDACMRAAAMRAEAGAAWSDLDKRIVGQ